MLTVLDLFSGIGGFSLGLERTGGFKTVAFCEIEPTNRRRLARWWPGVTIYDDVRTLTKERLAADGLARHDVVCGGFPCQDVSANGRGAGLSGSRSGLWFEMLRIIDETQPKCAIIENVAALRSRGLDTVLGGLASIGYDAEWHCISAAAIGADHERDRVWLVAYAARGGRGKHGNEREAVGDTATGQSADRCSCLAEWFQPIVGPDAVQRQAAADHWRGSQSRVVRKIDGISAGLDGDRPVAAWEGNTSRVVPPGYPDRRRRLISIGNSVVPQIPELIGQAILAAEIAG